MTPNPPTHPGNEPDADDMSTDPGESVGTPEGTEGVESEADRLGDFA